MIDGSVRPEDCGNRAIRSGTASDGTVGPRAIESEGGKTVKFHKQKITEKLAIRTGAVLTAYAIRPRDRVSRVWLCRYESASVVQDATRLNRSHPADKPND